MTEAKAEQQTTDVPEELRSRLALVLDVDDRVAALRLAKELQPWFGVAKVGLELFTATGPATIATLMDLGYEIFLDLKLHDIPNTVNRAAAVVGAYGVKYLTIHAMAGPTVLKAGVEGFLEGASRAGLEPPIPLAVTVLTSDDTAPPHILPARVRLALETHCGGLVCAAPDLPQVRAIAPRLTLVVPGIRTAGSDVHDQARVGTPAEAFANGADVLVVGRTVTAAEDRPAAAAALVESLRA